MGNSSMKVLMVVIRLNSNNNKADFGYHIPVGLAYITSVLKQNGYKVDWLNLNHHDGTIDDVVKKALSQERYDLILTGGLSAFYPAIKNCVHLFRKYAPNARVVLGGGAISSQPELIFKLLKPDYMVIGEGEATVLELLKCLKNDGNPDVINGIGYFGTDGKLVLTKSRESIKDIDELPFPDYEGLGFETYLDHAVAYSDIFDYPRAYPLVSSRSCPFSCTFCFHPTGKVYRQRSVPNIIEELSFGIKRYRINFINIYDELFSYDKERVYEFCVQIKQLFKTVPWEVKWSCQIRVDKLDEDLLLTMKEAGCLVLSLGLESYSPVVLKSMQKKTTPQQIDQALEITRRLNIAIQGNFIFGDPAETTGTAYETLNYWKKSVYSGGGINLGYIYPYPGTPLYHHCLSKGIIKDEVDFIENITTRLAVPINMSNTMTEQEFVKLQRDLYGAVRVYRKYVKPFLVISNDKVKEVHARCPYCNSVSIYKNYTLGDKYSRESQSAYCRHCRLRFYLLSSVIVKIENMLFRFFGVKTTYFVKDIVKNILKMIRYLRWAFATS